MSTSFDADRKVIDHLARLTRVLHSCLSELGYDQRLQLASQEISSSRDGLSYIVNKTTQAAESSLQAVENARPILDNLSANAANLHKLWSQVPETMVASIANQPVLNSVLLQTLCFLDNIPDQAASTQSCLTEIMVAQNFHDLTGQVIHNISRTIEAIEHEMLQLLIDSSVKKEMATKSNNSLLNGPVITPQKQGEVFVNQAQVDDLLTELGF